MFRCVDRAGRGAIERSDYERIIRDTIATLELEPGSDDAVAIAGSYDDEWRALEALAREKHGGRVTLDVWLAYREYELTAYDPVEGIDGYTDFIFRLLDRDGDGRIGAAEIRRMLSPYALAGETDFGEILARLDPHGRGDFTLADARALRRDFYLSDDENAPGGWILGRH